MHEQSDSTEVSKSVQMIYGCVLCIVSQHFGLFSKMYLDEGLLTHFGNQHICVLCREYFFENLKGLNY